MNKSDKKEKSYLIKVPVYTSEMIEEANDLFGGVTYSDMVSFVHRKIDEYKENPQKVSRIRRNKVLKKEIENVEYINSNIGNRPCILLKISAYNTNLIDGYVELDTKIQLKQNHKLGSDNNFILLVPNIIGLETGKYKHQWIILVYEDPNKDNIEIISTAKLVLNKVLMISTANIKMPEIMEELRKMGTIPELSLNFMTVESDENEVDVKFRSYLVESKLKKRKEEIYRNLPFERTNEIINDYSYQEKFRKRIVKILNGKKEYRITREESIKEAQEVINEAVEEIFNASIAITETELSNSIYEPEFIISKLSDVLINYGN